MYAKELLLINVIKLLMDFIQQKSTTPLLFLHAQQDVVNALQVLQET